MAAVVLLSCAGGSKDGKEAAYVYSGKKSVTVSGYVKNPGSVEFVEGATIYDMIIAAGGLTRFATLEDVELLREGRRIALKLEDVKTKLAMPNDQIAIWVPMEPL